MEPEVVPKVALLRCQSVSAAHGASVYQNHYSIASDRWPVRRAVNRPFFKGMTFSFCSPMIGGMIDLNLGLPVAWVVKCKKCACTINCRAIDPQIDHAWAAYRYSPAEVFKGPPGPSSNCHRRTPPNPNNNNKDDEKKPNAVLLIAASLIAAVRLNREEIRSSPSVHSKIADSIRLAEMIQARLRG
jgi:hypothetical protein